MTRKRILVVDDAPDIRTICEACLTGVGGHEVQLAANGSDGLAVALKWQPDLILLDVMMPGLDGTDVLKCLVQDSRTVHIPVIFLTASAQPHHAERYIQLGALGVIAKPFDPMSLCNRIDALLNRSNSVPH